MKNSRILSQDFLSSSIDGQDYGTAADKGIYRNIGKRALDICLLLVGLPFVLPVMLLVAGAIMLGGGPVFYTQPRLGLNGQVFRLWKFRSMEVDADRKLAEYLATNPEAAKEWRLAQKLRHDPRITPVGRVIRKTSLDELPQLFNVLKGEMSLVGPRPMMPDQRELYKGGSYEKLRPGISGLWQISARNDVSIAERARFDTENDQKVSLGTDVMVLAKTMGVVCRASGV